MNNTITVGLSLTTLKENVTGICAWIDSTNLATLPPIVNPAENADIDRYSVCAINALSKKFSGYISSITYVDNIYRIILNVSQRTAQKQTVLAHFIEDFIIFHILVTLYASQKQAKHITEIYQDRLDNTIRSLTHIFALIE